MTHSITDYYYLVPIDAIQMVIGKLTTNVTKIKFTAQNASGDFDNLKRSFQ